MIAALLLLGVQYASYTIPAADRPCPLMRYGYQESTTFEPNVPVHLPPFDTTLGTLTSVRITYNVTPTWAYRAEHPGATPTQPITWYRALHTNVVYRPSFVGPIETSDRNTVGDLGMTIGAYHATSPVAAFDGTIDYAGPSAISTTYGGSGTYTIPQTAVCTTSLELWYFSQPGTKTFYISPRMTLDGTTTGFPGHWASESDIRVNLGSSVSVQYTYY